MRALVARWLVWLRCRSCDAAPALRMDFLVKRTGPGQAEVNTLELTELGFSMLGCAGIAWALHVCTLHVHVHRSMCAHCMCAADTLRVHAVCMPCVSCAYSSFSHTASCENTAYTRHVQQACAWWNAPHACTHGRTPPPAPPAPRLCGRWTDGPQLVFGALLESCFDDVGATEAEAERLRLFRSKMHLQPSNAAAPGLTAPTDLGADDEDM